MPSVDDVLIQAKEVRQSGGEAPIHDIGRNVVTTLPDACRDASHRELGVRQ